MIREVRSGRRLPRQTDHQGTLSFLCCDLKQIMANARAKVPDYEGADPLVMFGTEGTLAYTIDRNCPEIHISNIINEPETPPPVILHILVHELLHLVVPSLRADNRIVHHSPEFWDRERVASPDGERVWRWLDLRWGKSLVRDSEQECMCIKHSWKKRAGRLAPHVDW